MRPDSHRLVTAAALIVLAATSLWAASFGSAAHTFLAPEGARRLAPNVRQTERAGPETRPIRLPATVRFREVRGDGLMTRVWVNGAGGYSFAIDTGAGATLLSERVAREAGVAVKGGLLSLGGLSGAGAASGREAVLRSLAVGQSDNLVPGRGLCLVVNGLPPGVDGVLDPTEAYWPLGYTIDLPHGELSAFDPRATPLGRERVRPGGAVLQWVSEAGGRRPFVMINGTRRALIDTGSEFGLAVNEEAARALGIIHDGSGRSRGSVRDIGGGTIAARRIAPSTVNLGSLVLKGVPTDLLLNGRAAAPILLGREALQPFQLTFDPLSRLIRIEPE